MERFIWISDKQNIYQELSSCHSFLFSEKFCGPSIESIEVPENKDESKDAAKAGYFAFQYLLNIYIER